MNISNELLKEFSSVVNQNKPKTDYNKTAYGTVVFVEDEPCVRLDGSGSDSLPLPIATTAKLRAGERVIVTIENHIATVTGNLTSPSATTEDITEIEEDISGVQNEVRSTYGTCTTASGTSDKVVVLNNFVLFTGAQITIKFVSGNTAVSSTLNVNDTGAKSVIINNSTTTTGKMTFPALTTASFTYDGTNWVFTGSDNLLNEITWDQVDGLNIKAQEGSDSRVNVTNSAVDVYDSNGNLGTRTDSNGMKVYQNGVKVADFGSTTKIGDENGLHNVIDPDSFDMFIDNNENTSIFHIGYPEGATITDTFISDGTTRTYELSERRVGAISIPSIAVLVDEINVSNYSVITSHIENIDGTDEDVVTVIFQNTAPSNGSIITISYRNSLYIPYYSFGKRVGTPGYYSVSEGFETRASGQNSHAEGHGSTASGLESHAEGYKTVASGRESHAEGYWTIASGLESHAEGYETVASGKESHAEGYRTIASGMNSHAEGYWTIASGLESHAEGYETIASGTNSHAEGDATQVAGKASHSEGYGTLASSEYQHVSGKFNIEDTQNRYVFIIGNGTNNNNRSNAFTVDWNGNIEALGNVLGKNVSGSNLVDSLATVTPISISGSDLINGSPVSGWGDCWYYKIGTRVHLHIAVDSITANSNVQVFTMPSGFRPYGRLNAAGRGSNGSQISNLWVESTGQVYIRSEATTGIADIEYDAFS